VTLFTDSYAIKDAIESVFTPVIEVHLSNLYKRAFAEPYRSQNVTAAASQGMFPL
jgi:3-dehydroquinate dehydratase-2